MPGHSTEDTFRRRQSTIWAVVLLFVLAPAWILLFLPAWLAAWFLVAWALQMTTVLWWLPKGRRVIFVYSNSPVWQD